MISISQSAMRPICGGCERRIFSAIKRNLADALAADPTAGGFFAAVNKFFAAAEKFFHVAEKFFHAENTLILLKYMRFLAIFTFLLMFSGVGAAQKLSAAAACRNIPTTQAEIRAQEIGSLFDFQIVYN